MSVIPRKNDTAAAENKARSKMSVVAVKAVVHGITCEAIRKIGDAFSFSGRLIIENDGATVTELSTAVDPHLRLCCRLSALLMQHLNGCLISLNDMFPAAP